MKKRTGINYGRKYAAITLAAVTAACTGATAGSVVTVAAAEAAIGLAILVVLFRNKNSINVEDLDVMKG